ncbi:TPA: hypothetical protein NKT21_001960 [Vibrio parahaemolyticus]|nr:hypothetical protein [Vibrio parahaemolyticus]
MIKSLLKKHIFKEAYVHKCSQTVYQSLMAAISVYKIKRTSKSLELVNDIALVLIDIQRPDGGYDIGYDFNFGKLHKKGESTSPELYAVVALNLAYDVLIQGGNEFEKSIILIKSSIIKSIAWIRSNAVRLSDDMYAIPYGPYSTHDIMVYNGVSFATGALGTSLRFFKGSDLKELVSIYNGFNRYLLSNLMESEYGFVWYYNVQSRNDLDRKALNKIDFYHQAQQLEMHAIAQDYYPDGSQLEIVKMAATTLINISIYNKGNVPYTNDDIYFNGRYYLWGMSSLVPGLLKCVKYLPHLKLDIERSAKYVHAFISKYGINHKEHMYFSVLSKDLKALNYPYMPRSDSWVVASRLYYHEYFNTNDFNFEVSILERIINCNYSGQENHAQNKRKKILIKIISIINKIK